MTTFAEIHQAALVEAKKAALDYFNNTLGGNDCFPCGFAWVLMPEVKLNTKVGKEVKAVGFKKAYTKGVDLWNPSGLNVQNVDAKVAGAEAYAKVLRDNGYVAYAGSRWD